MANSLALLGCGAAGLTTAATLASSFVSSASDGVDASSFTFTGQNIGSAAATRIVVVTVHGRGNASVSGVTIGGVSATQVVALSNPASGVRDTVAMFQLAFAAGTTANIVVTWSASVGRCAIGVFNITGDAAASSTATATQNSGDPTTTTINIRANGCAIAAAYDGTGVANSATWAGLTERYDATVENDTYTGASADFATVQTGLSIGPDWANAPSDVVLVIAAW